VKWLAILNPNAGHKTASHLMKLAREIERASGATCCFTTHQNHAREIVRDHPEYDGYIAVGGDTTVSEVVNGLRDPNHVLGIVPDGTSNDLARDLHLDTAAAAVQALKNPTCRPLDIVDVHFRDGGQSRQRKMISTAALGYVAGAAEVAYRFKPWLGVASHFVGAVWQTFRQREFRVNVHFDDEPWQQQWLTTLAVHNTQHLGTFHVFPEANIDDGQLNILYGRHSAVSQLREDFGILTRSGLFARSIHRQARRVEVELQRPAVLMVDGDLYREVDAVRLQVEPARLLVAGRNE